MDSLHPSTKFSHTHWNHLDGFSASACLWNTGVSACQEGSHRRAAYLLDLSPCWFSRLFHIFPSHMENLYTLDLLPLLCLHWPAGGEVFRNLSHPPVSLTPTPTTTPGPPLSASLLLMRGLPAQTSFHYTEGEHMLETSQGESFQTRLPCWITLLQIRALRVWPRACTKGLRVDMDATSALWSPLLGFFLSLHLHCHLLTWAAMDSCYDEEGAPSCCMPKFENVAFNRTVVSSNTCGSPPEEYCMQTGSTRSCHQCNTANSERSHDAPLLTDFHRNEESTWWQSQSMYFGIQHPNSVNLTLHLGKTTDIVHVLCRARWTCALHLLYPGIESKDQLCFKADYFSRRDFTVFFTQIKFQSHYFFIFLCYAN